MAGGTLKGTGTLAPCSRRASDDKLLSLKEGPSRTTRASVAAANRQYLHANHQGSIVALTDASGTTVQVNAYDAYGVTGAGNTGRFQYTGQAAIPDLGLYYYKARFYNPGLGRFMQTDPVGYEDQMNLYAYVANDPVNTTDPTGEFGFLGAAIGGGFQLVREIQRGSFNGGLFTKGGAKALARIGGSAAVGAVTGGVGSLVSKSVVGLGVKQAATVAASNAAKNAAVGGAAAAAGQVGVNTAEVVIDSGLKGAGDAIANGSVLGGAGSAAVSGAAFGGLGSVAGDAVSGTFGASTIFGEAGTLSPVGSAIGVTSGNAVSNLSTGDFQNSSGSGVQQPMDSCQPRADAQC